MVWGVVSGWWVLSREIVKLIKIHKGIELFVQVDAVNMHCKLI